MSDPNQPQQPIQPQQPYQGSPQQNPQYPAAQQPLQPQAPAPKPKKPIYKRFWFWLIVIVVLIFAFSKMAGGSGSGSTSGSSSPAASSSSASAQSSDSSSAKASAQTRDNSTAKAVTLGAGTWTVGTDVQPGRYVITTTSGAGNISSTDADAWLVINEILAADPSASGQGVKSVTTDVKSGQKIQIQGLNAVVFTPATTKESTSLTTGSWKVGVDIPAGSYTATPANGSESGNFVVYSGGLPLTNEILDGTGANGVKSVHVSLSDGDIVYVSSLNQVNLTK